MTTLPTQNSAETDALHHRALRFMPGGVSSPVRSLHAVADNPCFIDRGIGPRVIDSDGASRIDYICSWGASILGHAHPVVIETVQRVARDGLGFGATSRLEIALAEEVVDRVPGVEQVRFVCSGTEAVMSAIRLARAATGRSLVVKFAGGYHGHSDALLADAGSGRAGSTNEAPGVPEGVSRDTISLRYNDVESFRECVQKHGERIACVIVEPIAGNMGVVPGTAPFLATLRDETEKCGALLIFDEVMTGFRVARGGAQERTGITADIVTLGKVIGGGLPVAAYAARTSLMSLVAPSGPVYQAGTLAGNPVGMAAGLATLQLLDSDAYHTLEHRGALLESGLTRALERAQVEAVIQRVGSMLTIFFGSSRVWNYADAQHADHTTFAAFFRAMRRQGVLLPPSGFESWFVSLAHQDADIHFTAEAAARSLHAMARSSHDD